MVSLLFHSEVLTGSPVDAVCSSNLLDVFFSYSSSIYSVVTDTTPCMTELPRLLVVSFSKVHFKFLKI